MPLAVLKWMRAQGNKVSLEGSCVNKKPENRLKTIRWFRFSTGAGKTVLVYKKCLICSSVKKR